MCRIDSSLTWTQRAAHTTLPGTPQPLRQWMGLVVIFPTTRARNTRVRRRAQTPTCAPTVRDDSIFYRRRHGHTHRQRHCRTVPELLQIFPITTAVTSVSSAVTVAASAPQPESLPPTDLVSLFDELKRIDSTGSMGIRPGSITPSVSPINQAAPELTVREGTAKCQASDCFSIRPLLRSPNQPRLRPPPRVSSRLHTRMLIRRGGAMHRKGRKRRQL
mmetsp:Transcript_35391/g.94874  ORF Transcript_35391/g.94874 Transcript_35391/m.94874 type:complete len:218 (-) Transcript_35391:745-1398(-)